MAKKSASPGNKVQIRVEARGSEGPALDLGKGDAAARDEPVSVSLKYYRPEHECFSEWSSADLKKFSAAVSMMRQMNMITLLRNRICQKHVNQKEHRKLVRPEGLSREFDVYEIRVDRGNLARMHGVFVGSVFHLIWLDRHHTLHKV